MISEAYAKTEGMDFDPAKFVHGQLERLFKAGDGSVREVVVIHVYVKDGKLARTLDRKTLEPVCEDATEFSGFLTVSDCKRVFWRGEGDV